MSPSTSHPLVLVTCGGRKHSTPHPAGQLYTGTFHRLCVRAAHTLTDPASIRILSARHGLLDLATIVDPYDTRLTDHEAITAAQLREQAYRTGLLDHAPVVVLAATAYVGLARIVWPHAAAPLLGARGIGEQQQRLAQMIRDHQETVS